jgi:hypothetical protein
MHVSKIRSEQALVSITDWLTAWSRAANRIKKKHAPAASATLLSSFISRGPAGSTRRSCVPAAANWELRRNRPWILTPANNPPCGQSRARMIDGTDSGEADRREVVRWKPVRQDRVRTWWSSQAARQTYGVLDTRSSTVMSVTVFVICYVRSNEQSLPPSPSPI